MKRRSFLASLAGATFTTTACERAPTKRDRGTITVSTLASVSMSTFYVAYERGYFTDAGFDVDLITIRTSADATALAAAGRLDVAMVGLTPSLLNAILKGARLKLAAAREQVSTTCPIIGVLYGRRQAFPDGMGDLTRLRNRRVAIRGRASQSEFFLDSLLGSVGLSIDAVELILLKEPEAIGALLDGSIDAMLNSSFEFDVSELSPEIIRGPSLADVIPGYQRAFVVYGPSMLDGDRTRGVRFLRAFLRGVDDYRQGATPDFLIELAGKGRIDGGRARELCRETFVADGRIDPAGIKLFSDWALRRRYCERPTRADEIIDTTFLDEAHAR